MFPLDNKEPYIKANGSRSTLGEMFDEAGADVAKVKAALDDEIKTRAALGAHNRLALTLAEIKSLNTTGTWVDNVYTESDLAITISADSNGFVNNISLNGTTTASVTFELARDTALTAGSYILSSQTKAPVNFYFSLETPNVVCNLSQATSAAFTQTGSTIHRVYLNVGSGRTLSNFKVEPMIRYADDADPTYQPYAATNQELTSSKANKSDLASISITGTTNNTGSAIPAGTFFYLNGVLVRSLASIANAATLVKDTNYEEVTGGGLNLGIKVFSFTYSETSINAGAEAVISASNSIPAGYAVIGFQSVSTNYAKVLMRSFNASSGLIVAYNTTSDAVSITPTMTVYIAKTAISNYS